MVYWKTPKPIYQIDLQGNILNTFGSTLQASEHLRLDASQIARCARWVEKTAGGFQWRYMDEKDIGAFTAKQRLNRRERRYWFPINTDPALKKPPRKVPPPTDN